MIYIAPMS